MNFGQALDILEGAGGMDCTGKVARVGWNKIGMYIKLQRPTGESKMSYPFIYLDNGDYLVPWAPSQADLLEKDWFVV